MATNQEFQEDCIELLRSRTDGRTVDRRVFLSMAAALGVSTSLFKLTPAHAQAKEVVVVNWGGDAVPAMTKAWAEPFNKSGGKAIIEGGGPSSGKIKAMVESGKVTWDVVDRNLIAGLELGRQNLLEKIDYGPSSTRPSCVPSMPASGPPAPTSTPTCSPTAPTRLVAASRRPGRNSGT